MSNIWLWCNRSRAIAWIFILFMPPIQAAELNHVAMNVAIEMTPFFIFDNANNSGNFCVFSQNGMSKTDIDAYSIKAEKMSPPLHLELIASFKESDRCQFIFIDSQDTVLIQKSLPLINKQSLVIGSSEEIIFSSGHIALLKVGNRVTININKKNMVSSGIRPSSQILNLAKTLIE